MCTVPNHCQYCVCFTFSALHSFAPNLPRTTTASPEPGNNLRPMPRPRLPPSREIPSLRPIVEPIPSAHINYTEAIELSMYFYEAQRSGNVEPTGDSSPNQWVRPSGLNHQGWDGTDLTGGWYNGKTSCDFNVLYAVLRWFVY